jgi:hypothetical protein
MGLLALPILAHAQGDTAPTTANAPRPRATAADATEFRAALKQLPARQVDLQRAAASASIPAAASTRVTAPAAPIPLTPKLQAGEARWIPLPPEQREKARALIASRVFRELPAPTAVPPTTASPTAAKREPGVVPAPAAEPRPATATRGSDVQLFDGAVQTLSRDNTEVTLLPMAARPPAMKFDAARRRFETHLSVGLLDSDPDAQLRTLSAPITFEVIGDVTSEPVTVSLDHTSPPFAHVLISADHPRDPVELQVYSTVTHDPVAISVPVELPRLTLTLSPARLQGWGLETSELLIAAADGATAARATVLLAATQGEINPNQVTLDNNGQARAQLRSASIGTATINASWAPFAQASQSVDYEWPLRFLLAAGVGGVVGGVVRRGAKRGASWPRIGLELLVSVSTGLIVLALFVLGVNVLGFALPARGGEVLVFVVSALGAFLGSQLLKPKAAGN